MADLKVVVIGGGTGNFVVLRGLKNYPVSLSAIVTMADDGGSTGILRDELGVLPPGDVRQCLVALSNSSELMLDLMNYRFSNGGLQGHNFGNLLLSALEKVTGSFEHAIEEVGKILAIKGNVIPVTTGKVRLRMELNSGKILEGEREIYLSQEIDGGYQKLELLPSPLINPKAIEEVENADLIVIGPGGLFTSLIPNLLVDGLTTSLKKSKAKKVFVVNLMNRAGQTTGYQLSDYLREMGSFLGGDLFDYILVNNHEPDQKLLSAYSEEGDPVGNDCRGDSRVRSCDLLGEVKARDPADLMHRNLIRHDPDKLAHQLMQIAAEVAVNKVCSLE